MRSEERTGRAGRFRCVSAARIRHGAGRSAGDRHPASGLACLQPRVGCDVGEDAGEQLLEHVVGGVARRAGREEGRDVGDAVAGGHERELDGTVRSHLGLADRRHEAVADALAADGVGLVAALRDVVRDGLGGAAPADGPAVLAVRVPEVAEVADAVAVRIDVRVRTSCPGTCTTLIGNPVGDATGSVKTRASPARLAASTRCLRPASRPDSVQYANAVPTWIPAAPSARASASPPDAAVGAREPERRAEGVHLLAGPRRRARRTRVRRSGRGAARRAAARCGRRRWAPRRRSRPPCRSPCAAAPTPACSTR